MKWINQYFTCKLVTEYILSLAWSSLLGPETLVQPPQIFTKYASEAHYVDTQGINRAHGYWLCQNLLT